MIDAVQAPVVATGAITKADVLSALGDTDPNTTNAGKLQKLIGRGSTSTVQKHLDEIRASLIVVPVAPGTTPTPPGDAVAAIWTAAWSSAQVHTLGRLETVTAQRDALQLKADTQAGDITALGDEVDTARIDLDAALSDVDIAKADTANAMLEVDRLKGDIERMSGDKDAAVVAMATAASQAVAIHQAQVASLELEIKRVNEAAAAAQTIAQRDATITAAAMQTTIDRLTDQVSELKSLLHKSI